MMFTRDWLFYYSGKDKICPKCSQSEKLLDPAGGSDGPAIPGTLVVDSPKVDDQSKSPRQNGLLRLFHS